MDIFSRSQHLLLLAQLDAMSKWEAARRRSDAPSDVAWLWYVLAAIVAVFVVATVVYLVVRGLRRRAEAWAELERQGNKRDLTKAGLLLLSRIVKRSSLKSPTTVFTLESAFDRGASSYLQSSHFARLSEQSKGDTLDLMESLREKMDFATQASGASSRSGSRQISEGASLTISRNRGGESFEAVVVSANAVDMAIAPEEPKYFKTGQRLRVEFAKGDELLEFETKVVHTRNGNIILDHTDDVYPAGRRRHSRVAIERPAWIAPMPLRPAGTSQSPGYEDALLVEMSGPGIRLECPADFKVGDRIMVAMALIGGKVTHAAGKVVRLCPAGADGMPQYGVELIGLSHAELGASRSTDRQ